MIGNHSFLSELKDHLLQYQWKSTDATEPSANIATQAIEEYLEELGGTDQGNGTRKGFSHCTVKIKWLILDVTPL